MIKDQQYMNENATDPWEGGHNSLTNSKICYCRIYDVDAESRTCSIKTFGSEDAIANADYMDVQWLAMYSNPEGEEISCVPRLGSYGICVFVGGQPYIIGYFNPIVLDSRDKIVDKEQEGVNVVGGSAATNKEKINSGDFVFRTMGNCRLVLRAGGEIELEATKICRRTYFPARNRITEISQNLEISTDGGFMNWVHVDQNSNGEETLCTQLWRDDVGSTNVVIDEKGTVELGSNVIHRFQIKPGSNVNEAYADIEEPVYLSETQNTGETYLEINKTAFTRLIKPDGEYTRAIGEGKHLVNIKPTGEMHVNVNQKYDQKILDTGETTIDIAGKWNLNVKPSGQTTLDIGPGKATITITPGGEIEMKVTDKLKIDAGAEVDVKAPIVKLNGQVSGITTMNSHLGVVDLISNVPVSPSATVFGDV